MKEKATHENHPNAETHKDVLAQQDAVTGDVKADVLAYIGARGIIEADHIGLPYSAGRIHAAVEHLKGSGKISGDGSRIWLV